MTRSTPFPRPAIRLARAVLAAWLVLLAVAVVPGAAAAHAEVEASDPAANAPLTEPPDELRITFTEPIDPATAFIDLLDAQQERIGDVGPVEVTDAGLVAVVGLPELEPGVYTVSYQVISAVDGHATAGIFAFLIDPSGTRPAPTTPASSSSPSVDPLATAARWVALAGLLVALGSLITWVAAVRPALVEQAPAASRRPPWLLVTAAGVTGLAGTAAYLVLAARPIVAALGPAEGFPLDLAAPFGWTAFAIAMRVVLAASLVAAGTALGAAALRRSSTLPLIVTSAALMVALAGMTMAGHAAAIGGPFFAALDWVHLLAVAAWLGGLVAVPVLARRARGTARAMLRRHGRVALVAAPIVALTGLANSPIVLGGSRELVASGYGNLLLAKIILLSVAAGIGAANHFLVRGRGRGQVGALVGAELIVAALAVMTAATMVTVQPASSRQPVLVTPPLNPAHLYGEAGPTGVHASVTLPTPGDQTYQVSVSDLNEGGPQEGVQRVFLTFVPPPDSGLAEQRVTLEPDPVLPGLYAASGAYTPVTGIWGLEVTVRRAGERDSSVSFDLPVNPPSAPRLTLPPDTGVGAPPPLALLWSLTPRGPAAWAPVLVLLAILALLSWVARRTRSPILAVARVLTLALVLVAGVGAGSRALVAAANAPPSVAVASENPVPADAASVARGELIYRANCASCHGRDGDGDGPVVLVPRPDPLGPIVAETDEAGLSYRIANGLAGTQMPAFAAVLSDEDRWDLLNYLRDRWAGP
ncbi:MAG: copper resistance protein CopC [Candidatus Limnocylindria bacterium]